MLKIGHICDQLPATWSHAGHQKFFGNNLDHKRSPREGFKAVCPKTMKSNRHVTDSFHSARARAVTVTLVRGSVNANFTDKRGKPFILSNFAGPSF